MLADLFEVKETVNKGKGLYVKQFIPKGTIICFESAGYKIIPEREYNQMSEIKKEHIYRRARERRLCYSDKN
ncbi:MAG TPA: hypothetical protein DD381_14270 [Lentisphaeria bacterium]|nr:MAG: hypothetical protein A2X47_00995 [Lentisphaerae bacterium GWF2_38_69]HBM17490.1 hypothetical protein [Lentisphaeria bacterium]